MNGHDKPKPRTDQAAATDRALSSGAVAGEVAVPELAKASLGGGERPDACSSSISFAL